MQDIGRFFTHAAGVAFLHVVAQLLAGVSQNEGWFRRSSPRQAQCLEHGTCFETVELSFCEIVIVFGLAQEAGPVLRILQINFRGGRSISETFWPTQKKSLPNLGATSAFFTFNVHFPWHAQ